MNGKLLIGLAAAATLFVALCLGKSVNARKKELSPTRRVFIDGKAFVTDESSPSGDSLLEKELERKGFHLPDGFTPMEGPGASHPAFSGRLTDSPSRAPDMAPLPPGLLPEHTLRMEGEGAAVELVFGRMETHGPSIRSRLIASGWISVSAGEETGVVQVLQNTRGKETAVVCLDETEGTFLHFREVGR